MPYKLRKSRGKNLYWVVTTETGKKHSKEPIPLEKAKAQLRILESALDGSGRFISGKWTKFIQLVGRKYDVPESIIRATLSDNDRLNYTGVEDRFRFVAKRNNVIHHLNEYIDPTNLLTLREITTDEELAELSSMIERYTIPAAQVVLRDVAVTNPLQVPRVDSWANDPSYTGVSRFLPPSGDQIIVPYDTSVPYVSSSINGGSKLSKARQRALQHQSKNKIKSKQPFYPHPELEGGGHRADLTRVYNELRDNPYLSQQQRSDLIRIYEATRTRLAQAPKAHPLLQRLTGRPENVENARLKNAMLARGIQSMYNVTNAQLVQINPIIGNVQQQLDDIEAMENAMDFGEGPPQPAQQDPIGWAANVAAQQTAENPANVGGRYRRKLRGGLNAVAPVPNPGPIPDSVRLEARDRLQSYIVIFENSPNMDAQEIIQDLINLVVIPVIGAPPLPPGVDFAARALIQFRMNGVNMPGFTANPSAQNNQSAINYLNQILALI